MKFIYTFILSLCLLSCSVKHENRVFPYTVTEEAQECPLSKATKRIFLEYDTPYPRTNQLYSSFKYSPIKGFDYHNGDGTISRRDPSKIIFENGKYYVWYTHRETPTPPVGAKNCNDTLPSTDWDLAEIWYATSEDGFNWKEQGVAVPRPPKPDLGWRSVCTPDILKYKGKFYLYYQSFIEASGTKGDYCPISTSYSDSPNGPWKATNKPLFPLGKKGEWDQFAAQDATPFVHNGEIYVYYKSAFNRPNNLWVALGLATGTNPTGPLKKYPKNPVINSGHELIFFPFKEGMASLVTRDGAEFNTVQYAEDWKNFKIKSKISMPPLAAGPFIPDAFADNKDGRGITWGFTHYINAGSSYKHYYSKLFRFDCDLSLDVEYDEMNNTRVNLDTCDYFKQALTKEQRKKIEERCTLK